MRTEEDFATINIIIYLSSFASSLFMQICHHAILLALKLKRFPCSNSRWEMWISAVCWSSPRLCLIIRMTNRMPHLPWMHYASTS